MRNAPGPSTTVKPDAVIGNHGVRRIGEVDVGHLAGADRHRAGLAPGEVGVVQRIDDRAAADRQRNRAADGAGQGEGRRRGGDRFGEGHGDGRGRPDVRCTIRRARYWPPPGRRRRCHRGPGRWPGCAGRARRRRSRRRCCWCPRSRPRSRRPALVLASAGAGGGLEVVGAAVAHQVLDQRFLGGAAGRAAAVAGQARAGRHQHHLAGGGGHVDGARWRRRAAAGCPSSPRPAAPGSTVRAEARPDTATTGLLPKFPVPVAEAYCTDHPVMSTGASLRLNSSMKSLVKGALALPPPPYS